MHFLSLSLSLSLSFFFLSLASLFGTKHSPRCLDCHCIPFHERKTKQAFLGVVPTGSHHPVGICLTPSQFSRYLIGRSPFRSTNDTEHATLAWLLLWEPCRPWMILQSKNTSLGYIDCYTSYLTDCIAPKILIQSVGIWEMYSEEKRKVDSRTISQDVCDWWVDRKFYFFRGWCVQHANTWNSCIGNDNIFSTF